MKPAIQPNSRFFLAFASLVWALAFPLSAQALTLPGIWTTTSDLSQARDQHTATLLPSGKVLVTGDSSSVASAELFDPSANTWSAAASLTTGRGAASASLLVSGKVLVAGGNPANNCTTTFPPSETVTVCYATGSAELYTPAGNAWNAAASMAVHRQGHSAIVLASGKVLVAGGVSDCTTVTTPTAETFYCTYVPNAEIYDPTSNTWSTAGTLANGRQSQTATLLPSGKVLLSGGNNSSGVLSSAELYDPTSNSWSAAGTLAVARTGHTATLLASGNVYVAGGIGSASGLASAELYDPAANSWSAAANLTTARAEHTATLLPSGKVLLAGGAVNGNLSANPDLYDPTTNTMTVGSAMITPRYTPTATLLTSGKVLLVGGVGASGELASSELFDETGQTYIYTVTAIAGAHGSISPAMQVVNGGVTVSVTVYPDPGYTVLSVNGDTCGGYFAAGTATWTTAAIHADCTITASFIVPMSAFRSRSTFTATLLPSGKVLLAGGADQPTADLYDPVAESLSTTGAMLQTRYYHSATLLPSGKVLVAGGSPALESGVQLATTELYDPATNTWSAGATMSQGRARPEAALLSTGKVLVVGWPFSGTVGAAELYNPATNTWSAAADPLNNGGQIAIVLTSGKVLLVGGNELYNPTPNSWAAAAPVPFNGYGYTATLLASGKVLIAGGQNVQGTGTVATAALYDPTTNTWSAAASMNTSRIYHTATLLASGKVVVLGGSNVVNGVYADLSSAEIYDPVANTWSSAPDMVQVRFGHTATRLASGLILVAGGDYLDSENDSVELYGTLPPDEIFSNGFESN